MGPLDHRDSGTRKRESYMVTKLHRYIGGIEQRRREGAKVRADEWMVGSAFV